MNARTIVIAVALTSAAIAAVVLLSRPSMDEARCGDGFVANGARCCPLGSSGAENRCIMHACGPPFVSRNSICDTPDTRVQIPETTLAIGSSDWEAEGRVAPRTVHAGPLFVDAFEVTDGKLHCQTCPFPAPAFDPNDAARAASSVTRQEARVFCNHRGGRLPTEDEWIVIAAGASGKRYPWGDTGAVCRRAAFALFAGPCARGADGPDTVGAHSLGDSPLGVHDLAGNVAEWVEAEKPVVRGGSFKTTLAAELRTWSREELASDSVRDARVGFRCVYNALNVGGDQ